MKKKAPLILMGLFLIAGLAILFYPSISSWYNEQYQIQAVVDYDYAVKNMNDQTIEEELQKAHAYNEALANRPLADPFSADSNINLPENYTSILNINNGIMGAVQIPKINVNLPIYHGTSTDVLEKGVGHMEMTAFPVGGEGNHTVLTGHTALPNAKLFTDLSQLAEGDVFMITIYKQTLVYKIDQIKVVLPTDTAALTPEAGKDYVSLVTCTPYGINSHRLLVRGVKVSVTEAEEVLNQNPKTQIENKAVRLDVLIIAFVLVVIIFIILFIIAHKAKPKRRKRS